MLAETINAIKRRSSPQRVERVITPQTFVNPFQGSPQRTISKMSPVNLNSASISLPKRFSNNVNREQPISSFVSVQSLGNGGVKTGFSSVKSTIQNSLNGLHSAKKYAETAGTPFYATLPVIDTTQQSIIQTMNTRRVSFHDTQQIVGEPNHTVRYSATSKASESAKEVASKILADEFKNNLSSFEKKKHVQIHQEDAQSLRNNSRNGQTDNSEYIIQLLSESSKTKEMIERLITDNNSLLRENKTLLLLKEEYELLKRALLPLQEENSNLKEHIIILKQQYERHLLQATVSVEQEQQNLTISILQQQTEMLKNIVNNKTYEVEDLNKIMVDKDNEILDLHNYNADLTMKIKELLMELNRFNDERIAMVEENNSFRYAANQQIERLNILLQQDNNYVAQVRQPQQVAYRTIQSDGYDTRVQISGGYEELVLGKTSSPTKIRTTTYEIIDGVRVQQGEQYVQTY